MCSGNTEYVNRSKPWRDSNHEKKLLLSSIRPQNAVGSCTISSWLKKTLKQAGINTKLFKAHSTRPASSSKTSVDGAPIKGDHGNHSLIIPLGKGFITSTLFRRVMYSRMMYKESGKN